MADHFYEPCDCIKRFDKIMKCNNIKYPDGGTVKFNFSEDPDLPKVGTYTLVCTTVLRNYR